MKDEGDQTKLRRANRVLQVLGQVHAALRDETDETVLLQRICIIVVGIGHYRFAGVELADDSGLHGVARAAAQGTPGGLQQGQWMHAECERGLGAAALSTGTTQVALDLRDYPFPESRPQEAEHLGVTSMACIPLVSGDHVLGVLSLYASGAGAFDKQEITLLEGLAGYVAVGIASLRAKLKRRTELLDARETTRLSEERYEALFNHASDGIIICDASARNVDANEAGLAMLGYSREEFCGMGIGDLFPAEELQANPIPMDELEQGKSLLRECRLRRKDGTLVHVEISARQMPDGGLVSIVRDLSERHRAEQELRDMEAQLVQSQKMEAIGRLAGGVAHDFNNLLAVILSYAGFVAEELEDSDPLRDHIEEILKAGRRAAVLTRQLLAFGRKSVVQLQVLSLNILIEDMKGMLTRTIGEQVRLTIHLQPSLWNIKADPSQVEQILVNLVVNARDAMPAGGRLEVETANQEVTKALAARHPGLHAGAYVTLIVSDDGIGMTPEVLARVFEPFFTTKEKGKGTGLGLATVFGTVKQANGYVQVDSEPGKGARFIIYLPMTEESARQPQLATDDPGLRGGTETVLVVEDEDAVRAIAVRILTRNGFRVLEAANAGEALLACEQSNPPVDVVLTDVVMPRMSGPEMLRRLLERWPMLRAVYMSGYANDGQGPGGVLEPALPFVPKPFTEEQLVKTINAACGR